MELVNYILILTYSFNIIKCKNSNYQLDIIIKKVFTVFH